MTTYEVTGPLRIYGRSQGELLERDLPAGQEERLIRRGLLRKAEAEVVVAPAPTRPARGSTVTQRATTPRRTFK